MEQERPVRAAGGITVTHDVFDILLAAYDELGQLQSGIATGGSDTTLVDSGLIDADENKYVGGTLFVEVDADGNNATPEGEFAEVTAFDDSDGTLTVAEDALGEPEVDDIYSFALPTYKLDDMRHYLNRAIRALGPVPDVDESLTTAAGTTVYTIPIAAKSDLRQVWLSTLATAGNYVERFDWGEVPDADGAATTTLRFRQQPPSGETIRLVFMNVHPKIWDHDDELSEYIALERIVIEVAWRAARGALRQSGSEDKFPIQLVGELALERENMRRLYPIVQPRKPMKSLLVSTGGRHRKYGPRLP